jgi:hypothetical protein
MDIDKIIEEKKGEYTLILEREERITESNKVKIIKTMEEHSKVMASKKNFDD